MRYQHAIHFLRISLIISIADTQEANYNEIVQQMKQNSQETDTLTVTYNKFKENPSLENLSAFQRLTLRYYMKHLNLEQSNQLKLIFSSPDLSWKDVQWILGMLHMKKHYVRNKKLLDYTLSAKTYNVGKERTTTTASDGTFLLSSNLGAYTVEISKDGYVTSYYNVVAGGLMSIS